MHMKIEIDMSNAAFEDPEEVGRILGVAERWVRVNTEFAAHQAACGLTLHDINGNTVGKVSLRKPMSKEPPMDAVEDKS